MYIQIDFVLKKNASHHLPLLALAGNLALLNLCFVLGFMLRYDFFVRTFSQQNLLLYLYLNLIWIVLSILSGTLKEKGKTSLRHLITSDLLSLTFFFIFFLLFFQVVTIGYYFQREELKYVFAIFTFLLLSWKLVLYYGYQHLLKQAKHQRKVVVAGYGANARELKNLFEKDQSSGFSFKGYFDHRPSQAADYLGGYENMAAFVQQEDIDEVFITMTEIPESSFDHISFIINTIPVKIRFIPNLAGFSYLNTELVNYDMIPVIEVHQGPLGRFYNRWVKRVFDLSMSVLVMLSILSWLIPLLYLLQRVTGGGRLFFIQKRSGLDNKTFSCIKFTSMVDSPDANLKQASLQDPRITPLGRFLRKTNLDELPQFINVFLNQMSIVGPRPHMLAHTDRYKLLAEKFMLRQMVKPGITGLAQVRGFRGEIKSQEDLDMRIHFDLVYIEHWTFWMDIKIMLLTIINMIKGDKKAF